MKYIKVVLRLRDGYLESNFVLKKVEMVQIVLQADSRASASTNNCQKSQKEIKMVKLLFT